MELIEINLTWGW